MTSSYVYMAGSPTELYFPINLDGEEELKELLPLISRKGKRILTPFFIGVYQVDKSDKSSRTIVSHNVSATMESFNFAREHIGLTERLNPLLIHVIFSPPWNVDLVRVCFRDSDVFQRLAFSPSDNFPDFSKKDTSLAEAISKKYYGLSPKDFSNKDRLDSIEPALRALEIEGSTYGFTLSERMALLSARIARSNSLVFVPPKQEIDKLVEENFGRK